MPSAQDTIRQVHRRAILPRSFRSPNRLTVILLCSLALGAIVLSMTAGVLRNHDQASYVAGALQIASSSASGVQFYNYDKQYGTAWLLAGVLRLLPTFDPILICNLVQVALASVALAMLDFRLLCNRRIPLILLVPIVCSPALVFSLPFLGTSTMSLAFLVAAFAVNNGQRTLIERITVCVLVASAVACRADAILVIPALILAGTSRTTFVGLCRRPFHWALTAAAMSPIVIGQFAFSHTPNLTPLFLSGKVLAGFIIFGSGARRVSADARAVYHIRHDCVDEAEMAIFLRIVRGLCASSLSFLSATVVLVAIFFADFGGYFVLDWQPPYHRYFFRSLSATRCARRHGASCGFIDHAVVRWSIGTWTRTYPVHVRPRDRVSHRERLSADGRVSRLCTRRKRTEVCSRS